MSKIIMPWRGKTPKIADDAFIAPNAAIIGDVEIGSGASIWFSCTLRGDVHEIRVGENTNIQDGTVLHVTGGMFGCYVGSNVLIGHSALIHGCTIEDDSFIGMSSTVLDGAVVESGAMVAAGTLIAPGKVVRKGELWAGNPGKKMRDLTPEQVAMFPKYTGDYKDLGQEYNKLLVELGMK
ncbi:MAG: gamma carbonic anhydrase family protein [Rhodospirillales bacterium]|nr:gamma carbonic anhydrase family protein [Rhodospirillales bacterium]